MAVTREIVEQESARVSADVRGEIHLWKEALPLAETKERTRPARDDRQAEGGMSRQPPTLTAIMQRILAWPIESMPLTHTLNGSASFFYNNEFYELHELSRIVFP